MARLVTIQDFQNELIQAAQEGSLMTPKHDPYNLGTTYQTYRTVLSHDLADNLENFIKSGEFTVSIYENTAFPNSKLYCEIIPNQSSAFTVPASVVTSNSPFATSVVNRLIAVSGVTSGLHLFGEDSSVIQTRINNGELINKRDLL